MVNNYGLIQRLW